MLSVSVLLPTYNERENIVPLARRVHAVLAGREHEILVVDDRSPDGTGKAVRELGIPEARLLEKEIREGIGAALRYGYDRAGCDVLLSMDADQSFSPDDIPRLLERVEAGADLVLGTRHGPGGGYETPGWRVRFKFWVSRAGNRVVRLVTGLPLSDFSANFRAIRRDAWLSLDTRDRTNFFLLEMILRADALGLRIEEVPVVFSDRRLGRSKLNLAAEIPKYLVKLARQARRLQAGRRSSAARARQ